MLDNNCNSINFEPSNYYYAFHDSAGRQIFHESRLKNKKKAKKEFFYLPRWALGGNGCILRNIYTHLVWLDRETLRFFVLGVYRSGSGLSVWELYSSRFVYYFLSIKMRSKTFLLLVSSLLWGHGAAKRKRFFRAQHASTESLLQPRIVGGYDSEVGEFPYYGTLADDVFDAFRLVMES